MQTSAQGAPAASTQPTRRHRAPLPSRVDGPLPYPDLPDGGGGRFWLAAWLADQSKHEALVAFVEKPATRRTASPVLHDAFYAAIRQSEQEACASLKHVVKTGYLLCAWAGTTALEQTQ